MFPFAEMDAMKFKQIAQSMEKDLGVQCKVPADEPPMGASPMFDRSFPGKSQTDLQALQSVSCGLQEPFAERRHHPALARVVGCPQ